MTLEDTADIIGQTVISGDLTIMQGMTLLARFVRLSKERAKNQVEIRHMTLLNNLTARMKDKATNG